MRFSFHILTLAALLTACSHEHHSEAEEHETEEHQHKHEGAIEMSVKEQKAGGVVCQKIEAAPFAYVLHTSGRITSSAQGTMQVSAPVSGVVSGLRVNAGRSLAKGAPLLSVSATEQQRRSAEAELEAAQKSLERLERLAPEHIVSAEELEAARTRMRQAEIAMHSTGVDVAMPIGGIIQNLTVSNGQAVEAGDVLATITTSGQAQLLDALVPVHRSGISYTSARFKCGNTTATATTPVGTTQAVDADGCLHATFLTDSGTSLPIGAYCEVWLMGQERPDVLSVPLTALTEDQGTHYLYIREHSDCFRRQAVTLGVSDGERVEVLSGLKAGNVIVTQGTYAVRAAGQSAAIPGHTHNH